MVARYRTLFLLVAVVFAQLLMMAYQLRRQQDVPLIRHTVVYVVAPLQTGLRAVTGAVRSTWEGYIELWGVRRQNVVLSDQIDELKLENHRLRELAEQGQRLQVLAGLQRQLDAPTLVAQVLSAGSSETARIVLIDKGSRDGLTTDLPVMVPDGVVGKILHVFPNTAQVMLITDPYSGVASLLGDTRVHGILKGQNKAECWLDYVPNADEVRPGQMVYTSGDDQIYPKGLPLGVVVDTQPGVEFQRVSVQPLAKLNRLEEVLVILQPGGPGISEPQRAGTRGDTSNSEDRAPRAASVVPSLSEPAAARPVQPSGPPEEQKPAPSDRPPSAPAGVLN